jgi:peptide/nickel transport system substrate-binding protein
MSLRTSRRPRLREGRWPERHDARFDLASAFPEVSPDGLTYCFTLRQGITYSAGYSVRPQDFRYGLERALALSGDAANLFGAIRGADGCDVETATCDLEDGIETSDGSVTYHLARPGADLPLKLALPFAYPVPESVPFEDPGVGSGARDRAVSDRERERADDRARAERRVRSVVGAAQPDGFVDRVTWIVGVTPAQAFEQLGDNFDWFNDPRRPTSSTR